MKKLLPLLIVMTFAGCKKDTVDLLTRSWKTTEITMQRNGTATQADLTLCSQNRTWTFNENGTFLDEASSNCTPDVPDFKLNGTWTLTDKKTLKIEANDGFRYMYLEGEIVTITKSTLILRKTSDLSGTSGGGLPGREVTYKFVPR